MVLLISLILAEVFLLLCAKLLKTHPGWFYGAAALVSAVVTGLYWVAPEGLSPAVLNKFPLWLGALGTACFIEVMVVGAMPNGHPRMKKVMPIRGELSIFACLLTLGQNLSYGKNYLTPGYLFSGPISATKIAAWVSAAMIALMLILTVTSVKAVRRRFSPKKWKSLQRWAYLFYGLIYVHVLLMNVPGFRKGRDGCGLTVLLYSVVFLSYALCRVRKAVLSRRGQAAKWTSSSQWANVGVGMVLSLLLAAGLYFTIPNAAPTVPQAEEPLPRNLMEAPNVPEPVTVPAPTSTNPEEPDESAAPAASPEEVEKPAPEPKLESEAEPESTSEPESVPANAPETPPSNLELNHEPKEEPDPVTEPEPEPESEPELEPEPIFKYQDGVFSGTGEGYYGEITVSVTIAQDIITAITVDSYIDDDDYFGDAQSTILPAILSAQSPDVNAVSGATYSSKGIMDAVRDAMAKAEN